MGRLTPVTEEYENYASKQSIIQIEPDQTAEAVFSI